MQNRSDFMKGIWEMNFLYDTHAHLDDSMFDTDRHEVIKKIRDAGIGRVNNIGADMESSRTSIALAEERIKEQEAWLKMEKKVPEHAPWAPHGYARMVKELNRIKQNAKNIDDSQLNVILNTMRPGNLAELEDLQPLLELMEKVKELGVRNEELEVRNEELGTAIKYAEMVVKYVSDGSGTLDMIKEAERRIKKLK